MNTRSLAAALVLSVLAAGPAAAQATRTWVSGVGDDANPCSRTAPCKTFAGAISKTAAGGEINVLDPGGFGGVTITKSISIEAEGVIAGVLVSGTNGIIINAPLGSKVVLRGLTIEGLGTGLNGIDWLGGGTLIVEKCTINNFTQFGINAVPSTPGTNKLFVTDTEIRNNTGGGILAKSPAGVAIFGTITRVHLNGNGYGVHAEDNAYLSVKDTIAAQSTHEGFAAQSTSANAGILYLDGSTAANNAQAGVLATGVNGGVLLGDSLVVGNNPGLQVQTGGQIVSFGNNRVIANFTDNGAPTSWVSTK